MKQFVNPAFLDITIPAEAEEETKKESKEVKKATADVKKETAKAKQRPATVSDQDTKQATAGRKRLAEESRTERISLVVTPSLYKKIDNASRDKRQTINSYINDILKAVLGE